MKVLSAQQAKQCAGGVVADCEWDESIDAWDCQGNQGSFVDGQAWIEGDNGSWVSVDANGNLQRGNYSIGGP